MVNRFAYLTIAFKNRLSLNKPFSWWHHQKYPPLNGILSPSNEKSRCVLPTCKISVLIPSASKFAVIDNQNLSNSFISNSTEILEKNTRFYCCIVLENNRKPKKRLSNSSTNWNSKLVVKKILCIAFPHCNIQEIYIFYTFEKIASHRQSMTKYLEFSIKPKKTAFPLPPPP